jgi:outer membrane protein OmpA-like peptidoglycan-associated protein
MKRVLILTMMVAFLLAFSDRAPAQVTKTVKNVEKKVGNAIEKEIGNLFKKKKSTEVEKKDSTAKADAAGTSKDQPVAGQANPQLSWAKYDFVPGDQVIFEDDQTGEENGEFPSRWDLERGNVEIASLDGENVIMLRDGAPSIVPYFKDPQSDYLPDIFTIEMDLYYPGGGYFEIYLFDRKNQKSGSPSGWTYIQVEHDQMMLGQARSRYPDGNVAKSRWMHIAIAYTNGKLKAYMDDTRLLNIPRLDFDPRGLSLYTYHATNDNTFYIKNVRIAKGGVKYYDRVMQDGKIIVNGIRFDLNKATLKNESMGAINEIFNLLNDNPDLKLSVEGHTDSQGDDAFNMQLSEERATTVMKKLIEMGISSDRLSAKGWGETMPIANNASPEDMANNRRVEFVKK